MYELHYHHHTLLLFRNCHVQQIYLFEVQMEILQPFLFYIVNTQFIMRNLTANWYVIKILNENIIGIQLWFAVF
jgi:hypothetical protein